MRDARILEIGCGTGTLCNALYESGYHGIAGVDISEVAIAEGKRRFPRLPLHCMSASSLQFPDGHFDACMSFDMMEHVPDIMAHLRDVRRVLAPRGKYLFQTPNILVNVVVQNIRRGLRGAGTSWRTAHPSLQSSWGLKRKLMAAGFAKPLLLKIPPVSPREIERAPLPLRRPLSAKATWRNVPLWLFPNFWGIAQVEE